MPDLEAGGGEPRPAVEVLDRLLAVRVVVAVALGFDVAAARRLIDGYGVGAALTADEVDYLADVADGVRVEDTARTLGVEAVAVLAWALDLGPEPPLDEPAPSASAEVVVPDRPMLRPVAELRRMLELHAAMAWALRDDPDLAVGVAPGAVDPYVVHERHAALRWILEP